MNQPQQPPVQNIADDEIDLRELFKVIWQGKWIIIATTFVFAVASVSYALSLPDIYKSEVLLAPVSEDSSLRVPGQFGGLAALAGLNINTSGNEKTEIALQILQSRLFIIDFIKVHDIKPQLMAVKAWDRVSNTLIYDKNLYDFHNSKWVREVSYPKEAEPSFQESYKEFIKRLNIVRDDSGNMITISFEHESPYIAQLWLDKLITDINDKVRQLDVFEAEKSIFYLNNKIHETNVNEIKNVLFSLVEEQHKTLMLANIRKDYALRLIDPALAPEERFKPKRFLIFLFLSLLGFIIGMALAFIRYFNVRYSSK